MGVFDFIKSYSICSLCSLLWFQFKLQTINFLVLPLSLLFVALFPSHGRLSSHCKHKTRQTLFSISYLNHGVLLQQPKITKIVFFMTWVLKIIPALFLLCPFAFSSAFILISFSFLSFFSISQLSNSPDLDFCISSLFFHLFSCLYSLTHTLHNNTCRQQNKLYLRHFQLIWRQHVKCK